MADSPVLSDLRAHCRHQIGETCTLTYEGTTLACIAVNVSLGGALVETNSLPPIGEKVVFAMEHMGSILGTVVRCGIDGSAIRFDPDDAKAVGVNDMITFVLNQEMLDRPAD